MAKHQGNPFLEFGVGIENFFFLQQRLIQLFGVISVLALLQVTVFFKLNKEFPWDSGTELHDLTFGGISGATSFCARSPAMTDDYVVMEFVCNPGEVITNVFDFGVAGTYKNDPSHALDDINKMCAITLKDRIEHPQGNINNNGVIQ